MALTPEGAKLTELHKLLQIRLSSQSMAATKLLWSTMDPAKGAAAMDAWLQQQVALSKVFDGKSANLAADYIKKFRIAEGFPGGPVVAVKDFNPQWAEETMSYNGSNKVQALMDSGMTAKEAMAKVAPQAMAAAQRVVLNGGRRVVDKSALANPDSTGWRRVSDGHPCAFCAMLVTRGGAYKSEKSAGLGRHWHKRCGCTVEEVFGDWTPTPKEKDWTDQYNQAREDLHAEDRIPTTTNILEKMRLNGEFNDSPPVKPLVSLTPPPPVHLPPQPHPTLGSNFRVDHTGQVWKGYKYKVHGKEGVSWKKVQPDGSVLPENKTLPTKKQLEEIAAKKAAAAAKKAAEEAAKKAEEAAKAAAEELAKKNAEIQKKLGPNFRVGTDGTIWKGYKYKIQGKEGVSWKKVDESGQRIHKDPPTKKQLEAEAAKKAAAEAKKAADEAAKKASSAPKVHVDAPPVILKNDYQKATAAKYGWGQKELQDWVKSGKTMEAYHYSLTNPSVIHTPPPAKVTAAPGKGGMAWASNHWPGASKYTAEERNGFSSYTGSGYHDTNSALRSSEGRRGANAGLDKAFKRPTSVVPNDTVAYRGVQSAKALGLKTDSGDLSKLVGGEFVEHGYMSTAVEGSGFGGAINMTVKIPKGHRAVFVAHPGDALSVFGSSEKELLLDRGTRFKITEAKQAGGKWHVVVEVIPPPIRP